MRSAAVFVSALSLAASAVAQTEGFAVMTAPAKDENVPAGKTYTIVWEAGKATGPVNIVIMAGADPGSLELGDKIASSVDVTAGSYEWKVDCSLGDKKTYGIDIVSIEDPSVFQYSFPFHIDNSGCGSSGSSSSSSSSASGATASATGSSYPTSPISSSESVKPSETASGKPSASATASASASATVSSVVQPTTETTGAPSTTVTSVTTGATTLISTTAGSGSSSSTRPSASSSTSAIPTGAAPRNAAGSLALVGGLAAAVFAL